MKEVLKECICAKDIEFALLFGSFVTGEQHQLSDIDIGVYFKKEPDLMQVLALVDELEQRVQRRVDLVVLNALYTKHPLLAYEITLNHKAICILNYELYAEFQAKSYLYYFDLKPLYQMQIEAFKERIEHGNIAKTAQTRTKS